LLEGWHWLCWVGFWAGYASWRMERAQRDKPSAAADWPPGSGWRVLYLALVWCIPPRDSFRFGLHRHPDTALDYVFDHEVGAWHRRRSLPLGWHRSSRELLQNKPRLGEFLGAKGIPMTPTLAVVSRRSPHRSLASTLSGPAPAFCKMQSGNQGLGAFAAWREGDGLRGRTFSGRPLPDTEAVETAWHDLLKLDDALIQPRLGNHPCLASLGLQDEAITVRWISEWREGQLACLSAVLEVPTHRAEKDGSTLYTILPIEAVTGRVLSWPTTPGLTREAREWVDRLERTFHERGLETLPYWPELADWTAQAHAAFPDIYAIAWDWVITPEGPVLLEGNTGWGAGIPQMLCGGFLRVNDSG
jgi:hypothetical protein